MRNAAEHEDTGFGLEEMDRELAGFMDDEADGTGPSRNGRERLVTAEEADSFRERWAGVQADFVDEPKRAVEQADHLVDLVLKRLTEDLRKERDGLVRRWDTGSDETSTEELRRTLQGYRRLLDRLLRL